jgi:hypothetical protein
MFESKTLDLGYTLTTDSIPEKGMPSVDVHLRAAIDWSGLLCCPEGWRQNARLFGMGEDFGLTIGAIAATISPLA